MPRYFDPLVSRETLRHRIVLMSGGEPTDTHIVDPSELISAVRKDIKVGFDLENFEAEPPTWRQGRPEPIDALTGIFTLPNGLTAWGVWSGGDWEYPVWFLLYSDGSQIRAYIPTDGNSWHKKTKQAYGNAGTDSDDSPGFDVGKLLVDVLTRLQPKPPPKAKKR